MRHIKFCCHIILGYDMDKTNEILRNIESMPEHLDSNNVKYLARQGFPVIPKGIKTKNQFAKFCFEWARPTRLALDKMKLREILVSKELDLSKFE